MGSVRVVLGKDGLGWMWLGKVGWCEGNVWVAGVRLGNVCVV